MIAFNDIRERARFIRNCKEFSHFFKGTRFIPQLSFDEKLDQLKGYKTYLQSLTCPSSKYLVLHGSSQALKLITEERRTFVNKLKKFLMASYVYMFCYVIRMSAVAIQNLLSDLLAVRSCVIPHSAEVSMALKQQPIDSFVQAVEKLIHAKNVIDPVNKE